MIFKDNAMKYCEAGIPVIPLLGKVPLIKGWERWCTQSQTVEEVEYLIARYPDCNIGSPLGMWAGALDIDTNDSQLIKAARTMPFYTPFRRIGKTGFAAIFKASSLPNAPQGKYPIEFLNVGRQIVLPPSIHLDIKKEYFWDGGEDIFRMQDLPEFPKDGMEILGNLCERFGVFAKTRKIREGTGAELALFSDAGRNNKLVAMAYAKACEGIGEKQAVEELLAFDQKEHQKPWFSDKEEPHEGRDPELIAAKMFRRAQKAAHKNGQVIQVIQEFELRLTPKPISNYPKPRGMMRLFVDYCETTSVGSQDALGLGGALSLMAVLLSNRYRTSFLGYDVWPNLYTINIAHSGYGKETPQRALQRLLLDTGLLGSATYKSGTSLVAGLPKQQERLDLLDEISAMIKAMSGREDHKSEQVEYLCSLFSKSSTSFEGVTSVGTGKQYGACNNPCVNILGSTTPEAFKNAISREMAAKGLLPRCLLFWQKEVGEFKRFFNQEAANSLLNECQKFVADILNVKKRTPRGWEDLIKGNRYDPILIPFTKAADTLLVDIKEQYFKEGKANPDGFESAFKNRFAEHTAKAALYDAVSMRLSEITTESVELGHAIIRSQWEAASPLYELASAKNDHGKNVLQVLEFIRSKGSPRRAELGLAFPHLKSRDLNELLGQLELSDQIEKVQLKSEGGRPPTLYRLKKDLLL